MHTPIIKILIADDHEIIRASLEHVIREQRDMEVTAQAATGTQVIELVRNQIFDIVILDISMPQKNGIDTLRILHQSNPMLPILIFSGYPEAHYAVNLLRAGAQGYVEKDAPLEEILHAIRIVSRGKRYLSATAIDLISTEITMPEKKSRLLHEMLSAREFQIFYKLSLGKTITHIANELNISVKTASTHRSRILEKMHLQSNSDLTYYAIKNHLIE